MTDSYADRPFIGKGFRDDTFSYSSKAAVNAAVKIVENHEVLVRDGVANIDCACRHAV